MKAGFLSKIVPAVLLILLLLSSGCFRQQDNGSDKTGLKDSSQLPAGPVNVVVTLFPLADIISSLGGEMVEVTTLLTPGESPHTYEPTVEQAKAVARADLIVFVGGGLDNWIMKLAAASAKENAPLVELMASIDDSVLLHNGCDHHHHENDCDHIDDHDHDHHVGCDHDHDSHGRDPHIWMDPVLVKDQIAPLLAEKLKQAKPEEKDYFLENLRLYQEELARLHEEISARMAGLTQKRFISYHSAWNYFAHRYGLEEVASVETFPGNEPSAKWLVELVQLAKHYNIQVLFAEPQLSGKAAEVIAAEIGGEVHILDPIGGEGIPGRESYIQLMRYNAEIFEKALR